MAVDGGVEGVVAGRYRLLRVVGNGGMGRVWLARDEMLDRDVAVKEMLPVTGLAPGRADPWERTVREARTAARLTHPNVVRMYDVLFTDGRPWIVMEYVTGRSLQDAVRDDGPLDVPAATRLGLAVLAGLEAAHAAGVLHRDVKPPNVLLADDGRVLLGDFGVAVFDEGLAAGGPADVSREDVLLASPAYVAPERLNDGASTTRTDLWSFGATLYWAVEGRPPYSRGSAVEQLHALAAEPPDPMLRAGPLEPVIAGLLRRTPADRFTIAQARAVLCGATAPGPRPRRSWAGRRKLVVAAAALAVTAGGGATAYAAWPGGPARVPAAPAAATTPGTPAVTGSAAPQCTAATAVDAGAGPTALPAGWTWADAGRFRVGVPGGFLLGSAPGGLVCFLDPDGSRALTVDPAASLAADQVAAWRRQEQHLAQQPPPGYRNLTISPVLYRNGAADWEYLTATGERQWHTVRRSFITGAGRGFIVSWTTTAQQWDAEQTTFRTIMTSFTPR
ncbi:protein kinase domain-containing protein [Dactylosporangium sp. CA-139114]|uniref:serine/threonine-protein kinase n=1 Tax=Dactylosporangium sp. CA-139114 TaxID=3239931 RepID=UPI003D965D3A